MMIKFTEQAYLYSKTDICHEILDALHLENFPHVQHAYKIMTAQTYLTLVDREMHFFNIWYWW